MVQESREVRVFVSSTFRDMQQERDYLVSHVFPELRQYCRQRGVEFVEVDLRWGITEEQSMKGEVLPICLAEIERCQPYFIGLLGERYGWIPDQIDEELLDIHPWLKEHLKHSVTEMEILHGVLRNPEMADHAYFYFRSPEYIKNIPAEEQKDFASEDPGSEEKLRNLKNRIKEQGLPLRENYQSPEEVGKLILADLKQAIDKKYPEGSEPSPLDREIADHEAFGASRSKVYIGRQEYYDGLNQHVDSDGPPLVVVGESGSGKSALIANWLSRYREENPEVFSLVHYIGGTPDSADYVKIIRRIMGEIKRRYVLTDEIPTDPKEIRDSFSDWLGKAAYGSKFILILDALNQLEDRDNALDLGWLPLVFPPNVRFIVSALPGKSLDALEERNWPTIAVEKLAAGECRQIIKDYLAIYKKELNEARTTVILQAEQTSNPLFLKTLLNELRVFGKHDELDNIISYYLEAATIPELFDKVLLRFEEKYEKGHPGLVKEAFSLIWASRRGLAESELLAILGENDDPLPRAIWSPLFLAAEDSLVNRSGLFTFFHDYMRQAVKHRYLGNDQANRNFHLKIADYFEYEELNCRKVDELPWQLQQVGDWERLKNSLVNLEIFEKMSFGEKQYEFLNYWRRIRIESSFNALEEYSKLLLDKDADLPPLQLADTLFRVARFLEWSLEQQSERMRIKPFYVRSLELVEKLKGHENQEYAKSLVHLGMLQYSLGELDSAEQSLNEALTIQKKVFGKEHKWTARTLGSLAFLYRSMGKNDKSEMLFKESLRINEQINGKTSLSYSIALNNLGLFYDGLGKHSLAEEMFIESLETNKTLLGEFSPFVANNYHCIGECYKKQGQFEKAVPLFKTALKIRKNMCGEFDLDYVTIANNLAFLYRSQRDYSNARVLLEEVAEKRRILFGEQNQVYLQSLYNLDLLKKEEVDYNFSIMEKSLQRGIFHKVLEKISALFGK